MLSYAELEQFYEGLVVKLRGRGVVCAITSGMACVHYGVAETTKDCDLLCHTSSFPTLLELFSETKASGQSCHYGETSVRPWTPAGIAVGGPAIFNGTPSRT